MSAVHRSVARDLISIRRIGVFAYHGAYEEESRLGQRFFISIDARLDLSEAGRTDDLAAGVSYADIVQLVQEVAVGERFRLIEALAETIAQSLLRAFPRIEQISITVDKPGAAVAAIFDGLSVTITRNRA